jgi:hypothetical protein
MHGPDDLRIRKSRCFGLLHFRDCTTVDFSCSPSWRLQTTSAFQRRFPMWVAQLIFGRSTHQGPATVENTRDRLTFINTPNSRSSLKNYVPHTENFSETAPLAMSNQVGKRLKMTGPTSSDLIMWRLRSADALTPRL